MFREYIQTLTTMLTESASTTGNGTKYSISPSLSSPAKNESIMPDSEHVVRLLEKREGVTWQNNVMTELGWSACKTSRILSKLEDDQRITRYKIGRQKIVCLPGHEPFQVMGDF